MAIISQSRPVAYKRKSHSTVRDALADTSPAVGTGDVAHLHPCLFQAFAKRWAERLLNGKPSYSPTESIESRLKWAWKRFLILMAVHRTHPPTHEATIKFRRVVDVDSLKRFHRRIADNLRHWSKRHGESLAVFYVREIERSNCVHYHLLIRTSKRFPRSVLASMIENATDGAAWLQHCEAIESVAAFTRYAVKDIRDVADGSKELLLFKPTVGMNLCGEWNHYYPRPVKELWKEAKDWEFSSGAEPTSNSLRSSANKSRRTAT